MRRRGLLFVLALAGLSFVVVPTTQATPAPGPVPAPLTYIDPGPGGFMSPNISYVGTLANESPGVSARVVQLGAQRRLYVSSAKGLTVYDVTNPGLPLILGTLQTHNWENEDVAVSKDGQTVLMSDFEGILYLIVVHVETLPGGLVALTIEGENTSSAGNHTIECVDDNCDWAYGSEGKIYDLRDKTNPKMVARWSDVTGTGSSGHHVTRDANGLIWTDTTPIFALNPWPDPTHPTIVGKSDSAAMKSRKTAYQHNNLRPFATQYQPRLTPEDLADPNLRPGEILLGEGETNFTRTCGTANGPFATYDIRNFDQPGVAPFKPVDVFRPINGDYQNGDPAVNALGCSGHWFDISPASTPDHIITANGWYEHGTRVFDIDGKTAKIKQIGFFQPVVGSASASYWVGDEYIYTVDYERGVDILHYTKSAPLPTKAQFKASWLAKLYTIDPLAEAERYLCRVAATGQRA